MNAAYTISQLARAAGVKVSTVRYYERRGLLKPERRSAGNYRLYGPASAERLKFVRSAQTAGFTLTDIEQLLRLGDGEVASCEAVQPLITVRLEHVVAEIEKLRHVERMLREWLEVCRRSESTGVCGVLEGLSIGSAIPRDSSESS